MEKLFFILTFLFLIDAANGIYNIFSSNDFIPFNRRLLDGSQFSFTQNGLNSRNNQFPDSVTVRSQFYNGTMYGQISSTPLQSQVLLRYGLYSDPQNKAFATLISNTDISNSLKINTAYRILMSLFINGIQIDFSQAIVFDTENNSVSYQTLLTAQTEGFTDSQFLSNQNPCVSSPCRNSGNCIAGFNNNYLCVCLPSYTGQNCEKNSSSCGSCNNYQTKNPFSTTQKPSQSCNPNPCQNGGFCTFNKAQNISICLCSSLYTGTYCDRYKYSDSYIGKSLAIDEKTNRLKRIAQMNFLIEYLIVVDKTVVDQFNSIYQSLGNENINDYIRIMYSHLVNGINQRYYDSLANDPDVMIQLALVDVLILEDPTKTPWTSSQSSSNEGSRNIIYDDAITKFSQAMENMSFNYNFDYAVAVMNLDICYGPNCQVIGYTIGNGGIGIPGLKYSIIESNGFNNIQNAAHELGHSLGAVHDGTYDTGNCPASNNNIMTPVAGNVYTMILTFSTCSINAFKSILTSNNKLTSQGIALSNHPGQPLYSNLTEYPGQCFTKDQQCQLIYGYNSRYCNGTYTFGKTSINNDPLICQILRCKTSSGTGPCSIGGNNIYGLGALDGTPCFNSTLGSTEPTICFKGVCIKQSSLNKTKCVNEISCGPGGTCVKNEFLIFTTTTSTTSTTTSTTTTTSTSKTTTTTKTSTTTTTRTTSTTTMTTASTTKTTRTTTIIKNKTTTTGTTTSTITTTTTSTTTTASTTTTTRMTTTIRNTTTTGATTTTSTTTTTRMTTIIRTTTTTTSKTTIATTSTLRSLLSLFSSRTIQSNITQLNGNSFGWLSGFGMYSSSKTVFYYITDLYADTVYILNDEWKFISFKTFSNPAYMITIGNSLYMTGNSNVWKLDKDLNIMINQYLGGSPGYRGISYNPTNSLIYVVALNLREIQVFNLNLTLIRHFSTSPHQPWSITESSNKLYVGTKGGIIVVYQNEITINQFNGCNGNSNMLISILLDQNGYIGTSCDDPTNKLYLYSLNGSFQGKSLSTPASTYYIGFDSKGRFIQNSLDHIGIYN